MTESFDYTLSSGAKLHVNPAPFERAVALMEAVKQTVAGAPSEQTIDDRLLVRAEVRQAIYGVFGWATYDNMKLSPEFFDDPKYGTRARGDYFEICLRLIEVNVKPFFLAISLRSTGPTATTPSVPG